MDEYRLKQALLPLFSPHGRTSQDTLPTLLALLLDITSCVSFLWLLLKLP